MVYLKEFMLFYRQSDITVCRWYHIRKYLLENITDEKHVIYLALDTEENKKYWDSTKLNEYLLNKIENDNEKYFILLDEIQKVNDFVFILNDFLYKDNVDVYVTGSNLKMLVISVLNLREMLYTYIHLHSKNIQMFIMAIRMRLGMIIYYMRSCIYIIL